MINCEHNRVFSMHNVLVSILSLFAASAFAQDELEVLSRSYSDPGTSTYSNDSYPTSNLRGQFRPVNFTVLSAGIEGKLSRFDVKNGSTVRKDELIARFSCAEEDAEYLISIARVKVAQKNLEVNRKLDAYQNISEVDLIKSEAEVEITKADAKRALAVVEKCEIRAPFDATVTEKQAQAHQYVKKGDPLLQIVDTRNLEIEMVLPSLDVTHYAKGRKFTILVDETGLQVEATVDRVVNVIDPVSQTIRVIGVLTNDTPGLMPGMSGIISFDPS